VGNTGTNDLFEILGGITDAMLFVTDVATAETLWVNNKLVEQTGYTLEDYQFQRFENPFMPAEDIQRIGEFLGEFLPSSATTSELFHNRFIDRWGGTLHVQSRIAKVVWEGQPALLYSTVLEETDRQQSIEVEQRYRSLVEAASDSIVRLRTDLTVQYSNQCFQDLLGRTPVALSAQPFTELVLPSHRESASKRLLSTAERFTLSIPLAVSSGDSIWLEGTFVRISSGEDAGLLQAILRDTSESRRLNERMQRAQKRETLGQMAGGIAHDLNNILTGIMGSAILAERAGDHGSLVMEALADIQVAAQRAGELSASMLAYAGEGESKRVTIDVAELTSEMKALLASGVARELELRVTTPSDVIPVLADEVQLRQVVMNLITNAADATRAQGGTIKVEAGVQDRGDSPLEGSPLFGTPPVDERVAFVRVSDGGAGMSPEVLNQIFDPFFSTKAKGRGLGLAAALGILERHGGCVRVASELGQGTVMEIELPLSVEKLARRVNVAAFDTTMAGEGPILIVDDEVTIRSIMGKILVPLGYNVLEAGSGEEALRLISPKVRVVVLDQTMPGMSGDRTFMEIRARFPDMPIVRTSGYSSLSSTPEDGLTVFISKPFGVSQLIEAVQRVLPS
jgi:two-component system cell cycle sensor histidine kinase/response regulator CckA